MITGGTGNIYIASTKDYITNGNIADLRIVNGTAVYTANFTPPTAPLTAITNTVLLTCQSNRFKDNSINNITSFTFSGTSSVSKFSPYAPTAYSKSIHGGSLSFNGTGTLSTPNSVANVTNLNFTVECWVNFSTNSIGYQPILGNTGTADYQGWICILESNNTLWFRSSDGGSWAWNISSGVVPSINNWHHIAVVRNGINLTMYLNGVSISTIATLGTSSIHSPTGAFYVGRYPFFPAGSRDFTGSMADVRVVKGTAVYTANFTPPTAPLTAITNTSLLLSGTNAGIVDNSMNSDLVTVGSAQVDTTIKKYGSSSMKFNGTTDYLLLPASPTNNLATGSWTLESWVNPTNYTNFNTIVAKRPSSPVPWSMFIKQTTGLLSFYTGTSIYYSSNAVALNSWSHVACVYSGTTLTMFINGVSVFSGTVTMGADVSSEVTIGAISAGVEYFTGNISDVRISKTARYTANFTPPTNSF